MAELARRYFTSRGPATVKDCADWSGLTMTEVRRVVSFTEGLKPALAAPPAALAETAIDGVVHYYGARHCQRQCCQRQSGKPWTGTPPSSPSRPSASTTGLSWKDTHERHGTVSNLFFWIIILSFLIPMAMRMYRKSVARRNQDQSFSGRYPDQFPGGGIFPGSNGPQSKQPRDGFTQQDYFSGGFRQLGRPAPLPPGNCSGYRPEKL